MLYRILQFSVMHQQESTISTSTSTPSKTSLPSPVLPALLSSVYLKWITESCLALCLQCSLAPCPLPQPLPLLRELLRHSKCDCLQACQTLGRHVYSNEFPTWSLSWWNQQEGGTSRNVPGRHFDYDEETKKYPGNQFVDVAVSL